MKYQVGTTILTVILALLVGVTSINADTERKVIEDSGQTYDVYYESNDEDLEYIREYFFSMDAADYSEDHEGRKFVLVPKYKGLNLEDKATYFIFQDDLEADNKNLIQEFKRIVAEEDVEDDFESAAYYGYIVAKAILVSRDTDYGYRKYYESGEDYESTNEDYHRIIVRLFDEADVDFDYRVTGGLICSKVDDEKARFLPALVYPSIEIGYTYNSRGRAGRYVPSASIDKLFEEITESHLHENQYELFDKLRSQRIGEEGTFVLKTEVILEDLVPVYEDMYGRSQIEIQAVNHLSSYGVIQGTGGTDFSPDMILTREQMAKVAVLLYERTHSSVSLDGTEAVYYADKDEISEWALEYILKAEKAGLMNGYGKNEDGEYIYGPKDELTLQQAEIITLRIYQPNEEAVIRFSGASWEEKSAQYDFEYRLVFNVYEGIDPASSEPASRSKAMVILNEGASRGIIREQNQ